jgi:hypothetical protein
MSKCWRELGFVPKVHKETSRVKKSFQELIHLAANDLVVLDGEGEISSGEDADSHAAGE